MIGVILCSVCDSARPVTGGCPACAEPSPGPPYVTAVAVLASVVPWMERGVIIGDSEDEVRRAAKRRAQAAEADS